MTFRVFQDISFESILFIGPWREFESEIVFSSELIPNPTLLLENEKFLKLMSLMLRAISAPFDSISS